MLQSQPASLHLRYLQTLTEIAAENNSTTIFPLPMDMFSAFFKKADNSIAAPTPEGAGLPPAPTASTLGAGLANGLPQIKIEGAKKPADPG
jgi:hypothetical protein